VSDSTPVSGVSGRYATALFELADETGALDGTARHVDALAAALADSADLRALIASPLYAREEQAAAMAAVCDRMGIGAPVKNFVALLAANRRLFALPEVIRDFRALLDRKRGVIAAEVRSATPLSAAQRADLERTLKTATGRDVALDLGVDESLIGGLVVKVGSKMIDTSIRSKLAQLQTAMKEAGT
jgi:F-type H+-transporting ATPase subunit delta